MKHRNENFSVAPPGSHPWAQMMPISGGMGGLRRLLGSWKQEMAAACRIHRFDSLLLLSGLFTLHTWAGRQIHLQCCHRTLSINISFFLLLTEELMQGVKKENSIRSPETFACVRVCLCAPSWYSTRSTSLWLKWARLAGWETKREVHKGLWFSIC